MFNSDNRFTHYLFLFFVIMFLGLNLGLAYLILKQLFFGE